MLRRWRNQRWIYRRSFARFSKHSMAMCSGKKIGVLSQALMETQIGVLIGAGRHERSGDRTGFGVGVAYAHRDDRVAHSEQAVRNAFSVVAAASSTRGARAAGGGAGSVRAWTPMPGSTS
jgi:hypothetical protein